MLIGGAVIIEQIFVIPGHGINAAGGREASAITR